MYITKVDGTTVPAGSERVLAQLTGPGYVRSLWMAVDGGSNPTLDARIRVYYDGATVPAIDIDLGTLLAIHWGGQGNTHTTDHVHVEVGSNGKVSFLMTLPMPFGSSITITYYYPSGYTQTAGIFSQVAYSLTATDRAAGQRLRCQGARFADQSILRAATDVNTIATITGTAGSIAYISYVGGANATAFTWLERNFSYTIDGETNPSIVTTGSEDTFDSGWYFQGWKDFNVGRHSYVGTDGPSSMPYCVAMATDLWGKWGGVPFTSSAVLRITTKPQVTTGDRFCYCVLYYQ